MSRDKQPNHDCFTCRHLPHAETCAPYNGPECPNWQRHTAWQWLKSRKFRLSRWLDSRRYRSPERRLQERLDTIFYALCILIVILLFK